MDAGDVASILPKLQSVGFCADLEIPTAAFAGAEENSGELFEAVLASFLREMHHGGREARPLPATLGDGRRVDLVRLFAAVRAMGGYDAASGGWASASEAAGLDAAVASPLKLVYAKYLVALDRWLQRVLEAKQTTSHRKEPFLNGWCEDGNEKKHVLLKRKREEVVGMLNWVRELAKNARDADASVAGLADGYLSMALLVREVMARKTTPGASLTNGALAQKVQAVFPPSCKCCACSTSASVDAQAKCSQSLQPMIQQPISASTLGLSTVVENMNRFLMTTGQESNFTEQGQHDGRKLLNSPDGWLFRNQQRNEIPVGSNFQAEVPEWTGKLPADYNDPDALKWLGTQVWPPENENKRAPFMGDPIGKGRRDVCECEISGSVECVRFHVAERRLQLKCELGSAFHAWGFDRMGEEVALSWTEEEEAKFKAIVRLNPPSLGRDYWDHLHLFFRSKGRKRLVSYYFNVFLLRRRCYQNRVTPNNIDSDDEQETEFRFLGNPFGHDAIKYHNTKHTVCIQNTHCMDLDE